MVEHQIESYASRLVAEDSTLQDERTAWALRVERLQHANGTLKADVARHRESDKASSLELGRAHGRCSALEEEVAHAHAESERILVALTTEVEAHKAEKRALASSLEAARQDLEAARASAWGAGGEAKDLRSQLEAATAAHAKESGDASARAATEQRRLLGELKQAASEGRELRAQLDATRLESDKAVRAAPHVGWKEGEGSSVLHCMVTKKSPLTLLCPRLALNF
jgi:chromosome segregation ATPase